MYEAYDDQMAPLISLFYDYASVYNLYPCFYIPICMIYFVGFFVIFEFTCNIYADLSGFADR